MYSESERISYCEAKRICERNKGYKMEKQRVYGHKLNGMLGYFNRYIIRSDDGKVIDSVLYTNNGCARYLI